MAGIAEKIGLWQWLPIFGWRIVASVEAADQVPQRLPRNGAVVVGTVAANKWIVFDCPCRNGHRIMLNTDSARRPFWRVTRARGLSVEPSIDSTFRDLHCHYWIRNGRVEWFRG